MNVMQEFIKVALSKLKEQSFIVIFLLVAIYVMRIDGLREISDNSNRITHLEGAVRDCQDKYDHLLENMLLVDGKQLNNINQKLSLLAYRDDSLKTK